jgi:hypothetical protein
MFQIAGIPVASIDLDGDGVLDLRNKVNQVNGKLSYIQ